MDIYPVDYLIMAPLEEEFDALRVAFGIPQSKGTMLSDGSLILEARVTGRSRRVLGIALVKLAEQGQLHAAVTTARLIETLEPCVVASFGIAGGFCSKGADIHLGDTIVPKVVYYYEPAKERVRREIGPVKRRHRRGASETQPRVQAFEVDPVIFRVARQIADQAPEVYGKVSFEPIASGEKLIADVDAPTRRMICGINDKIVGVDMEAAGVAVAARSAVSCPAYLCVKGVSDDASSRKAALSKWRPLAAAKAATFIRKLVECTDAETPRRRHNPIDRQGLDRIAADTTAAVSAYVTSPVDRLMLRRVIATPTRLPRVFCHWRMRAPGVHWVDVKYLMLMRRLTQIGYPVSVLVTEQIADAETCRLGRQRTEFLVGAMLGACGEVAWESEVMPNLGTYESYAESLAFDAVARAPLRGMQHTHGPRGLQTREQWLLYMAWRARSQKRCIVVQWHRHAAIATQLMGVLGLDVLVLPVKDMVLGGQYTKHSDVPSGPLLITPPDFPEVRRWLSLLPDEALIAELADLLSPGANSGGTPDSDQSAMSPIDSPPRAIERLAASLRALSPSSPPSLRLP